LKEEKIMIRFLEAAIMTVASAIAIGSMLLVIMLLPRRRETL
jgi:hypothetical protein